MKRIFVLGFLFLPTIIFPQIPNAGFEDGLINWLGTGSLTININTSTIYDELQSLECIINSDMTNGDLRSEIISGIQENTVYTLSAWLFDNDPSGRARLVIEWYNDSNTHISNSFAGPYTSDQTIWQQLTINVTSPANAAGCKVGCRFYDVSANWDGDCTIYLDLFSGTPAPLPVELTSFIASISKNTVHLLWQTATEVNNYGFEIQRSASQTEHWITLGLVKGNGNSNTPKFYSFTDNTLTVPGRYLYRIKQVDTDGNFEYSKTTEADYTLPLVYGLVQNYPNPFNPSTKISFAVPKTSFVSVKIYNVLGNQAAELFNGTASAGKTYDLLFDGSSLASGIYYCVLDSGEKTEVKKMMLLR